MHVILIMMESKSFKKWFFFLSTHFLFRSRSHAQSLPYQSKCKIKASKFSSSQNMSKLNCVCFCVKILLIVSFHFDFSQISFRYFYLFTLFNFQNFSSFHSFIFMIFNSTIFFPTFQMTLILRIMRMNHAGKLKIKTNKKKTKAQKVKNKRNDEIKCRKWLVKYFLSFQINNSNLVSYS